MSSFVLAKVQIAETAATIGADGVYVEPAVEAIKRARADIERQVRRDPFFLATMEPYDLPVLDSRVVSRMCEETARAGVGPMAAVAGAIASEALDAMIAAGCAHGWVDNGGDIALVLSEPATIEVFSDPGSDSAFALEFGRSEAPFGVCTSSGRLGHSTSFGNADAAVVIAKDAYMADALATAIGNRVRGPEDLKACFEPFSRMPGLIGSLVMIDGQVAMTGKVPKLVEVEHSGERITVHSDMSHPVFTGRKPRGAGVRA